MQTDDPDLNYKRFHWFTREIVLLEMFNSPHIIELYELVQTNNNFYAFIEYANGGSLQNLLNLKGRFSELVAREILIQIVKGFEVLYSKKIVHRDLKLDNILVSFPNLSENITQVELQAIDLEK